MARQKRVGGKAGNLEKSQASEKPSATKGYWELHAFALSGSAKQVFNKGFWKTASLDALAITLIWVLLFFSGLLIEKSSEPALQAQHQALAALESKDFESYDLLNERSQELQQSFKRAQAVAAGAAFILLILIISVFYDAAWAIEKERKFEYKDFGSRYLANAFWIIKWLLIVLLVLAILPIKPAALLVMTLALVALYADPAFRYLYDEKESALQNTTRGFKVAFTKALKYLPFLASFIIFSALLLSLAYATTAIPQLSTLLTLLSVVVLLGWARAYVILLG